MSTKVVTGKVRFSFCNIFEPKAPNGGGDAKYSVTLLIPKSDTTTLGKIKDAMAEARENFCKRNGASSLPVKPNHTLHDGDGTRDSGDPYGPECKGCYVITVSSKQKPVIVDAFRNEITDPGEVYSGCYGRVSVTFFAFNTNGNRGIACGLNNVQKIRDGEPLGGHISAEHEFAGFSAEEEAEFLR